MTTSLASVNPPNGPHERAGRCGRSWPQFSRGSQGPWPQPRQDQAEPRTPQRRGQQGPARVPCAAMPRSTSSGTWPKKAQRGPQRARGSLPPGPDPQPSQHDQRSPTRRGPRGTRTSQGRTRRPGDPWPAVLAWRLRGRRPGHPQERRSAGPWSRLDRPKEPAPGCCSRSVGTARPSLPEPTDRGTPAVRRNPTTARLPQQGRREA